MGFGEFFKGDGHQKDQSREMRDESLRAVEKGEAVPTIAAAVDDGGMNETHLRETIEKMEPDDLIEFALGVDRVYGHTIEDIKSRLGPEWLRDFSRFFEFIVSFGETTSGSRIDRSPEGQRLRDRLRKLEDFSGEAVRRLSDVDHRSYLEKRSKLSAEIS